MGLGRTKKLYGREVEETVAVVAVALMLMSPRLLFVAILQPPANLPAHVVMVGNNHYAQQEQHGKHGTYGAAGGKHTFVS